MRRLERGEVWWAAFDERCAIVILSAADPERIRGIMIVPSGGAAAKALTVEVPVGADDHVAVDGVVRVAFPRPGHVNCNWLVMLSQDNLVERAGVLPAAKLLEVEAALQLGGVEY
jgi:mRNA interferase MazF